EPASARRALPAELAAGAGRLAAEAGTGPDTVLLAAWKALLHRLGRAAEVRVGTLFSGRADEELREAVGPFAQHLPLATRVESPLPFRALVERVHGAREEAAGWQDCFDAVDVYRSASGDAAAPEGTLRQGAGFSALPAGGAYPAGALVMAVARRRGAEDPFALHLVAETAADGAVSLELRGDGGSGAEQLARMLERWETLLADALARPDAAVGALAVASAAERERVLERFGRAEGGVDASGRTVVELFEEQAARTPDAPALRAGGETVTYAELRSRAGRAAAHLRSLGVGPETRVGIMLPGVAARVESVLAVLAAGGAYVPLDPAYPRERLAYMVRDAGLRLVLTGESLRGRVPEVEGTAALPWEEVASAAAALPDRGLRGAAQPAGAAYVIYTSGSTGAPKGVVVEHRALAAHALAVRAHYGLGPDDRVLQFASFSFDPAVEQTLPPLAAGACVVLRGDEAPSTDAIAREVAEERITLLNLPTAQWHVLAEEWAGPEGAPAAEGLRLVIAGGEAMLPHYVERWHRGPARGARLLNAYGPTEAVVTASAFDVPAGFCDGEAAPARVPVGRPFGERSAYVLDERMEPAPIGIPGELYLGGRTLARGYLGRPELTAERFVPDPFGGEPGGRLYRTGDLARFGEDGTLAFLGRADEQVKVRGFRIEPGEVVAALALDAEVGESAVVVEERGHGEKQLVAYWVPAGDAVPDAAGLRARLAERLPEYLLPGAFVALRAMPLTPAGKVDRARLATAPRIEVERPFVAPSTPLEAEVAEVWAAVMGRERASMDDDFFVLGGHSLLATQLTSRLRRRFAIELPVGAIFDAPVVADLAREVEARVAARGERPEADEEIGAEPREAARMSAAELEALLD
ncbi:MAG TPA: amino acid adenylation domain-containing protein, partial [Longimicrobiaceae bacterium]|nr:amino acid adenylation domain-containing protein [Longimicrobiaceae bacterium]